MTKGRAPSLSASISSTPAVTKGSVSLPTASLHHATESATLVRSPPTVRKTPDRRASGPTSLAFANEPDHQACIV